MVGREWVEVDKKEGIGREEKGRIEGREKNGEVGKGK